jgi:hypothetical protein
MLSHRPAAVLHAAFWAEDGRSWFAAAYMDGPLAQLVETDVGYLQLVSRLIADVALLVPLHLAPTVMGGLAVLVDAVPVVFLFSRRADDWAPLRYRALMSLIYLCVPNTAEWHDNATGTQWAFALFTLMIVLARPARTVIGRSGDMTALAIGGLTGPFGIFLFPVATIIAWARGERWRVINAAWILLFAVIQGIEILSHMGDERSSMPTGASFPLLVRILCARIFAGALLHGHHTLASPRLPFIIPLMVVGVCAGLMFRALRCGSLELRLFVLFAVLLFAAAMAQPVIQGPQPRWILILALMESRYYLFPMLAFLICLGCVAFRDPRREFRVAAALLLCLMPIGAARGWKDFWYLPEWFSASTRFPGAAHQFESSPPGARVLVPANPSPTWSFVLVKH